MVDFSVSLSGGFGKGIRSIFTRGEKVFEISNHLGNVLTTVSDRKVAFDQNIDGTIDFFRADVVSAQDYYAFGMIMPGRKISAGSSYRYGFNGKEEDDDVKGDGNQQDYGMRIYDPRLGKFLSVDAITKGYPELTPYQFASNSPIFGIDRDGLELFGHNFLFDVWLTWKYGDPTGARTLKQGVEEKAAVQKGLVSYSSNVPPQVESKLDKLNNIQANAKIARGVAHLLKFNVETSFNVT
jgi:RHS repeat-associated protein